ncbi:MAG: glycosyltransferase [Blastochloris viridis]|uniref:Glycosyltransferase n=1 Tax=Blastochloris viridis TaxID=1079 RepID=A0A6N4RC19_BLAVI|nr:MAG: glycosyltransferase [Blastochloris viridis]
MKILHAIFSTDFAGSENNCAQLAMLQYQAGHEVRVVIKGRNPKQVERFRQLVAPDQLIVIPAAWPSLLDGILLKRIVKTFKPDVIHTHLGRATKRFGKVAKALGIPHIASLHLQYEPKVYGACNGLVCVAGWQRASLSSYKGKVAVIRNWVPRRMGNVKAPVKENPAITRLGSVGRLDNQKGYDILLQAFRQAFPKGDETVELVIIGEGPNRAALEAIAAGDARIRLPGYSANVPNELAGFDAFISSSRFEGLALVVLEAIGAKLPMLLTDVAGNRELADLQPQGVVSLVPPEDITAMAEALKNLTAKPLAPVNYDVSELDESTVAVRMVAFYQQVIGTA